MSVQNIQYNPEEIQNIVSRLQEKSLDNGITLTSRIGEYNVSASLSLGGGHLTFKQTHPKRYLAEVKDERSVVFTKDGNNGWSLDEVSAAPWGNCKNTLKAHNIDPDHENMLGHVEGKHQSYRANGEHLCPHKEQHRLEFLKVSRTLPFLVDNGYHKDEEIFDSVMNSARALSDVPVKECSYKAIGFIPFVPALKLAF